MGNKESDDPLTDTKATMTHAPFTKLLSTLMHSAASLAAFSQSERPAYDALRFDQ